MHSTEDIKDRQQLQLTVAVPLAQGTDPSGPFQGIPRILYDPKTHHGAQNSLLQLHTICQINNPPPNFMW